MHFSKYLQKKKNISDYYKEQLKKKTVRKKVAWIKRKGDAGFIAFINNPN